jgi:hypothetical protein
MEWWVCVGIGDDCVLDRDPVFVEPAFNAGSGGEQR